MAEPGYEGFAALGDILTGGAEARAAQNANTYRKQAFDAADAWWQAKRRRSQALIDAARLESRGGITPELLARANAGDLGAQAELQAATLGSNQTVDLRHLGDYQQPHFGETANIAHNALLGDVPDADGAVSEVDPALYNRARAYIEGKDYQPVRVAGGAYIADGVNLGDLDAVPTPETAEKITALQARTAQGQQRTNAYVDKTRRAPAAKPPTARSDEAAVLAQARERIAAGASPAKVAEYLRGKGYPGVAKKLFQGE